MAVLLFLLVSQPSDAEIDRRVDELRAQSIEVRSQAEAFLKSFGMLAIRRLEQLAHSCSDPDSKRMILRIISSIRVRDSLIGAQPDVDGKRFVVSNQAAQAAIEEYNHVFKTSLRYDPLALPRRNISICLDSVTLWQALESLAESIGMTVDDGFEFRALVLNSTSRHVFWKKCDVGSARILVIPGGMRNNRERVLTPFVRIEVLGPPGTWMLDYRLSQIVVKNAHGEVQPNVTVNLDTAGVLCQRAPEIPTRAAGRSIEIPLSIVRASKPLSVEGAIEIDTVQDVEYDTALLENGQVTWQRNGVAMQGVFDKSVGTLVLRVNGSTVDGFSYNVTVLDSVDGRIGDFGTYSNGPGESFTHAARKVSLASEPHKIAIWRVLKVATRKIQFGVVGLTIELPKPFR